MITENITKISELQPLFTELLGQILSDDYIDNLALGLDYKREIKIPKITKLQNMSMNDFVVFKNENPDRNVRISNVITEYNCEVEKLTEETIIIEKNDFCAEKIVEFVRGFVAQNIKNGLDKKAQMKMNNDLQDIL
ncbi:hypothetical protein DLH72_02140 [Candidatus Gracilibacteria bacterium]|nr:MAG: hypothetical protein DLH72_02140 [Candidatus Gracilibacteria bacterium]